MPKKYDVVAITGEYQKQGQTKPRYQTVGMIIEKDGKHYLKMNSLVTMHDNGNPVNFFSLYEPRTQAPPDHAGQQSTVAAGDFDDDIPFNVMRGD